MRINNYRMFLLIFFIFFNILVINIDISNAETIKQKKVTTKKPRLIFWYTVNPGFPPPHEWNPQDTGLSLYKEMQYGNMKSRAGSKEYFIRLKKLGFDAIVLNGFHGPYKADIRQPSFPSDLEHFLQSRNYNYYIPWAKEAGLEPFLQIMFFSQGSAASFSWFDDNEWKNIETFLSFVAKVAKSSGCKGISFDFEPYYDFIKKNPWRMIKLDKDTKKREEILLLIKKRSSQMAKAIYKEFPNAAIHMYGIGAGASTFLSRRMPVSAKEFIGDDFGDIVAYFLAGFFTQPFGGGVHIDEASTYYEYNPERIEALYMIARLIYIDNVIARWDLKDYIDNKVTIGLGLVVHNRWGVKKYWDKVKYVDKNVLTVALNKLLVTSPYIWVYPGETDWIYPEIADQLPIKDVMKLDGTPYKSHSQRMQELSTTLQEVINSIKNKK